MPSIKISFWTSNDPITGEEWPDNCIYHDEKYTAVLPARWEICGDCYGEGKTYLGWAARDQPAFSVEDFDREGEDFMEDYMAGRYDRACPSCKGSGKSLDIDEAALKGVDLKIFEAYSAYLDEDRYYQRELESERRFGC